MKRILVTGGAGLIGSHLCEQLLNDGDEVLCLDNYFSGTKENVSHLLQHPRFELIRHDVTVPILLEIDQIYHLARPAAPVHYQYHPVRTVRSAVEGTAQMLELARHAGARFVLASSGEVYGESSDALLGEESVGALPLLGCKNMFIEGNRCAESMGHAYQSQYGVDVRIARIFNTYGPRMPVDDGRVVSNFILQALDESDITMFGDGKQTRSFCYVTDIVSGLIRLMNSVSNPAVVNLGSSAVVSIAYLAKRIVHITGSRSRIIQSALPDSDPKTCCPDITYASKSIGFSPSVTLDDGLITTIDFFEKALKECRRPYPRPVPTPPPLPSSHSPLKVIEA